MILLLKYRHRIPYNINADIERRDYIMEDKKNKDAACLNKEDIAEVSGGKSGFSGGYCPQTPDRTCRVESVGQWDPENEDCKYCGWRAW